jgi:hypothetical protein
MTLYVKYTRDGQDIYGAYEGQDEATVTALVAALGGTDLSFITQDQYIAALPQI